MPRDKFLNVEQHLTWRCNFMQLKSVPVTHKMLKEQQDAVQ